MCFLKFAGKATGLGVSLRGIEKVRGCGGETAAPPPDAVPALFLPLVRLMMMNKYFTFLQVGCRDLTAFSIEQSGTSMSDLL